MIKNIVSAAALLLLILLPLAVKADSKASTSGYRNFEKAEIIAFADDYKQMLAENYHLPYMGLAIVYNGDRVYTDGTGYEDPEKKIKINPRMSRFGLASTAKIITYLAIMQLAEQGKIDLNEDIFTYLDFGIRLKYNTPIRIIDLMNHKGGFEDQVRGIRTENYNELIPLRDWLITNQPKQVFQPGTYTAYSNYGISLLGQIVATVSGLSYEDYTKRYIFDVLGMENSTFEQRVTEHFLKGYRYNAETDSFDFMGYEFWNTVPASSLRSTPVDMAKLLIALLNSGLYNGSRVIGEEYIELLYQTSWAPGEGVCGIAHGLFEGEYNGYSFLGHGGTNIYQHTAVDWFPELGVGLFITAGNDDAVEAVQLLKYSFINTFYEKRPVKYNHTVKIDVSGYAGTYYPSRRNFSSFEKCSIINSGINFTSDGDSLYFYSDKLNSVNENFFTNDSGNIRFIFDIDKNGDISGVSSNIDPSTYLVRQNSTLVFFTGSNLLLLSIVLIALIGITRFIIFLFRKIKKKQTVPIVSRAKLFSNIFIGYAFMSLPVIGWLFINRIVYIQNAMLNQLLLNRIIGFILLLYVPFAAIQIFRTFRLLFSHRGYYLLKTTEIIICLLLSYSAFWFIYWKLVWLPGIF